MGRYHYWHLHPFTLDEDEFPETMDAREAFRRLMKSVYTFFSYYHSDGRTQERCVPLKIYGRNSSKNKLIDGES